MADSLVYFAEHDKLRETNSRRGSITIMLAIDRTFYSHRRSFLASLHWSNAHESFHFKLAVLTYNASCSVYSLPDKRCRSGTDAVSSTPVVGCFMAA